MDTNSFLSYFSIPGGLYQFIKGSVESGNVHWAPEVQLKEALDEELFFGPAQRQSKELGKKAILGTNVLWVDVDSPRLPKNTLPPSVTVFSGHGWHLYWFLDKPITDVGMIEALNKLLIGDTVGADKSCWNVDRYLRVPGSTNKKHEPFIKVEIKNFNTHRYSQKDIESLKGIDKKTKHKIRTGDTRGYNSRSERDWAVVQCLVAAGCSDELIKFIFDSHAIGDKTNDENTSPNYLKFTIERARASRTSNDENEDDLLEGTDPFVERPDGLYALGKSGYTKASTFTIEPKLLLDGSSMDAHDAFVCKVMSNGYEWDDVVFTRQAFNNIRNMDKECPVSAWQWLGTELSLRKLLPYLLDKLRSNDLPKTKATTSLGLHKIKDVWYFIGTDRVLTHNEVWAGFDGPVAWLPSNKEHATTWLMPDIKPKDLNIVKNYLPKLNNPEIIWPMIGWYTTSLLKPWIEEQGYRFPILSVTGTRGSGKTTLIKNIFMKLFGHADPKTYDAGTTKFVILALLGSSVSLPVAFSEFRYDKVEVFIRYILLSYDTGHDPRGRADQTTVDYPLSAPFTLDGEDMIDDPAAKQRIVVAKLRADTVSEGSEPYLSYKYFYDKVPKNFSGAIIQYLLQCIENGSAEEMLNEARNKVFAHFKTNMPDRVRNNHIVTYFGCLLFCKFVGMDCPPASVMTHSIKSVYNLETQRSRLVVDDMIEDCVNAVANNQAKFKWSIDPTGTIMYFQLGTAHPWWTVRQNSRKGPVLEREAIRNQLTEVEYATESKITDGMLLYGIDLDKAQKSGLDVPGKLNISKFTVEIVT
jgi:hypothetical protein